MYAKLEEEKFIPAPRKLMIDGALVYNPTSEQLKAQGYKPVQETEHGTAPEGMQYTPRYKDTSESIKQTWELEIVLATAEEVLLSFMPKTINTLSLDNNTALRCITYHPEWQKLCEEQYKTESKGFRFQYEGKLYETVQPSHTFQSQWVPGTEGTSSIYSQVNWIHDGTLEDPIPVPENVNTVAFTYIVGKYYDEDGTIWKCQREGEEDGTEHSFVYKPSEAVGYFIRVE